MSKGTRFGRNRHLAHVVGPAILFVACLGPALCQWQENGRKVPDKPWSKSDGSLGVMLVLTDKPDEFYANWAHGMKSPPPFEKAVARRGAPLVGVVIFTGCAGNDKGNCDAGVTYVVLKPDGAVYGKPEVGELWAGKPAPPPGGLQLGVGNIGVVIEPKDALGTYTIRAEIEDRVAKKKLLLERTFEAVAAPEPKK
jgi:hypothetical protein